MKRCKRSDQNRFDLYMEKYCETHPLFSPDLTTQADWCAIIAEWAMTVTMQEYEARRFRKEKNNETL